MKTDESMSDDSLKEIEELRARAKAGDPAAQIEIAEKLFSAIRRGEISRREGNGDAFRWVRTAEINPNLSNEQRVQLAEKLLKYQSSLVTWRTTVRLLVNAYKHGEDTIRGRAAWTLGKAFSGKLFQHSWRHGRKEWIKRTTRNIPRSLVWLRRAARLENAMAAVHLYEQYLCGHGVLANEGKARVWQVFAKEIMKGQSRAVFPARLRMNRVAERGGTTQKKFESAREKLFQAESEESVFRSMDEILDCANEGYAPAMALWSAEILDTKQKSAYAKANIFLRDAVRQEHPEALALAGRWLLFGGQGLQQDFKLARKLLDHASALGNAHALAIQCGCALTGWGEPKNLIKAKELWTQAEKLAMAQEDGRCLYELFLVSKALGNLDSSFHLLRPAAEAGDVRACFALGRIYHQGLGVPVDKAEAWIWIQKAAFRRHPTALYALSQLIPTRGIEKATQIPAWLGKALQAGIARAGIELGFWHLRGKAGILRNWQEAERLFRRFCPLEPKAGYTDRIIEHFLAKPIVKRSDRDRRFLDRARNYLRDNAPERAALLFQEEAPDFVTECTALTGKKSLEEDDIIIRAKELETCLSKAESDWQSDNKEQRRYAGETFIKWARYLSSPAGRTFVKAVQQPTQQLNVEDMVAMFARCYWRAAQTLLLENDLTTDAKKSIDFWIKISLQPFYRPTDDSMDSTSCPDFVREIVSFCGRNTNRLQELGLSFETIMLGHEVAVLRFDDKSALTWLIENKADERLTSIYIYLEQAVDEKIPLALRIKADQLSAMSLKSRRLSGGKRQEIAELLREAAEGGDAEAQCRQGEALAKDMSPKDWREHACEWFLKAANQGHKRAAMQLGKLLSEDNPQEAIQWLKKVAENAEADTSLRTSAECELGKLFLRLQQPANAANHLRTAAQHNNRAAMKLLALEPCFRGPLSDEEIQKWCRSVLKHEDAAAPDEMDLRGRLLTRHGQMEKDKSKRADWFRKAAEAGDGPGAYEWARCLIFGDGCERNLPVAEKWFDVVKDKCKGKPYENRDLAAHAYSWYYFLLSLKSTPITTEHVLNARRAISGMVKGL